MKAYDKGIKEGFEDYAYHIKSQGFTADINTNLIERFLGTIKERTKTTRGFKSWQTAEIILERFQSCTSYRDCYTGRCRI